MRLPTFTGLCLGLGLGACLLTLIPGVTALAQDDSARSARAQTELDALRDRIDRVRQQIAADKGQRSSLSSRLATAEARISSASKRLRNLEQDIVRTRQRVASLTDRRNAERAKLGGQLDSLRAQVRAAYASGRIDRMRLLLSDQSPEKLGRMLVYYEYFAKARTQKVNTLRDVLADLAVRQNALAEQQAALDEKRAHRARTLSQLEADQSQQRKTIAALDKRLSSHTASLDDMQADAARLKKLMRSLSEQLSELPAPLDDSTPFAQLKGHMTPPVGGAVLARFGSQKAGGPLRWQGEWLAAPEGAPVKAVAGGRVVYVGYMHRYGLIVVIDHGHNYYSLYGHAQGSYVEVGDRVKRGQPVAQAGRSGGHSRSGAYFEIRRGQTAIDPASWLSG